MRRVGKYVLSYKWLILLVFFFIFVQSLSQLFLPTLMGDIVDNGVVEGDIPYIWKIGFVMLLVAGIGVIMSVFVSRYSANVAMGIGRDIRRDVFTHVSDFSLHEFDELGTASLITRTTNDVTQLQQASVIMLRMFLTAPFMLFGGLIMALSKDAKLSLVIFITIPFIVGTIMILLRKVFPLFQSVQKRLDQLNLIFRENLTGVRVIRSFAKEPEERERLKTGNTNLMDVSIKVNQLMAFTMPVMMLLMNLTTVFVIWFGGLRIDSGNMQIGDLMAFIQYVMLIMFALMMASMMFVVLPRAIVSANRIQEVLDLELEQLEQGDATLQEEHGKLTFDDVTFHYQGAAEPALKNISFTAEPGKTTAIIGGTGSGKTTLIQLIPRFYEITSGSISVNDKNIKDIDLADLRKKVGLVPQEALLFSGTIADNIRFGKEDATEEEIHHAAEVAQAKDFIEHMPDQYDSIIEQSGANLSGGQKQRLSIARALVRQADMYIFDDSFSALDYKTDRKLREALQEETSNKTMLIVAQRVSTIMDADQIIVLDKGEMAGIGTHEELLASNELYQEIVTSQFGEGEIA